MNNMTEKEKMLAGKIYDPSDKELENLRIKAHRLSKEYNDTFENEEEKRNEILDRLLPNRKKGTYLQGPIQFDYGVFTTVGENFYANFNLTVLDSCPVNIGDNVLIGPNVSIMTALHPLRYQDRNIKVKDDGTLYDDEYAKPITIGNNCWIASGVIITGGVTIGNGCVIGAGSVVTRDIPDNCLAAGNPCKVIRKITENDDIKLKRELF